MKFSPFCLSLAIPAIALVAVPYPSAEALSSREVGFVAEAITVRIDGQNPGSGVLIKQQGGRYTVLTAAHVVATEDEYEIVTPDDERYFLDYQTVQKFPGVDLALVEFTSSKAYRVVEVGDSNQIRSGDAVYVSGFPMPTAAITEPIWNFSPGSVTANAKRALADGYALVYTNNTLPGMSGGAVLDQQGKLIGVHGRADTDQQAELTAEVRIKTGFNLAIPINTFRTLVAQVNPNIGFATQISVAISSKLTADDWFLSAGDKSQKRDFRGAIADYDKAIALQPDNAVIYYNRAVARDDLGDSQGAIADYDRAIAINPSYEKAYVNRGLLRDNLGDQQGALDDYNQAIALQPDDEKAYYNRGLIRDDLGDRQGAIADYDTAIALQPDFVGAYGNRGVVRSALGDKQGAIADYSKVIALQPDDAKAYYNRGIVRSAIGDPQGAIFDFRSAARLFQAQGQSTYYEYALDRIKALSP